VIEYRARNWVPDSTLAEQKGKILTAGDYSLVCTGPVRLLTPQGQPLAVYLPGVLSEPMGDAWPVLSSIRMHTDNRGLASGTQREQRGDQKRTRTRRIMSNIVGAIDPGASSARNSNGRIPACRLTAWTGKHLPEWQGMAPLFQAIDAALAEHVPTRWKAQRAAADACHPDWLISGTTFTTVTVNNTYSTGVHQDVGDLPEGFSTLAVGRRGDYTGGYLVLPRYRVAFDLHDGDLLMFDAHEHHGNTDMRCPHQPAPLAKPCPEGCERVSLVSYFRTKVQRCESAEAEQAKLLAHMDSQR
jgi:hypothetical protein